MYVVSCLCIEIHVRVVIHVLCIHNSIYAGVHTYIVYYDGIISFISCVFIYGFVCDVTIES